MKRLDDILSNKMKKKSKHEIEKSDEETEDTGGADGQIHELPGERIMTDTVSRGSDSTIHTAMEHLHLDSSVSVYKEKKLEYRNPLKVETGPDQAKCPVFRGFWYIEL